MSKGQPLDVDAVRARHKRCTACMTRPCHRCNQAWPCDTAAAVAEVTRLRAELDAERAGRATAWEEGYEAAEDDEARTYGPPGPNGPSDPTVNPYWKSTP